MMLTRQLIVLLCLIFLVASCGFSPGDPADESSALKKMHINAGLFFALALPASWKKIEGQDNAATAPPSARWRSAEETATGRPEALLRVVSRPPEFARGGFDRMERDFFNQRPAIEKLSSTSTKASGYPARRIIGRFDDRRILVVFVTTSRRAFTFLFTTDADQFDDYRPLFEEILQSFQVL